MNKKTIVVLILLGTLLATGCTSEPMPENTLKEQIYCIKFNQGNEMYDLLSNEMKEYYTKDDLANKLSIRKEMGIYGINDYNIIEKTVVSETVATMKVEIAWNLDGYQKTEIHNTEFVLEDGLWKINSDPLFK
ncbi:MAG: hypothetical protein KAI84_00120 [Gammaproteobacteria bacterium]|nr:hypothetical protein [Gammaproteobacteria bacterium]